jgi:hypothetical protein
LYSPFRLLYHLSLSLFSSSENRSSFEFILSLPRQTRLVFFSEQLFFWKISPSTWLKKVIVSTALFSKMSLILLLTFLLIPMSSLPLSYSRVPLHFYDVHFM